MNYRNAFEINFQSAVIDPKSAVRNPKSKIRGHQEGRPNPRSQSAVGGIHETSGLRLFLKSTLDRCDLKYELQDVKRKLRMRNSGW